MNLPPIGKLILVGFIGFFFGIYVGLTAASPNRSVSETANPPATPEPKPPTATPPDELGKKWVTDREIRQREPSPLYSSKAREQWMQGHEE